MFKGTSAGMKKAVAATPYKASKIWPHPVISQQATAVLQYILRCKLLYTENQNEDAAGRNKQFPSFTVGSVPERALLTFPNPR